VACSEGQRPLGAVLHSSNEPSELSQWPCGHDDSTINTVMGIIIIIIIKGPVHTEIECNVPSGRLVLVAGRGSVFRCVRNQWNARCSGACAVCVCVCDACRTSSRCVVRSSVSGCCYSFASVFSYELSVFVRRVSCPCFFAACNCWNIVSLTPTTDEIMRYVPFQCLSVFQRDDSRSWGRILAKCSLSKDYWGLILYPLLLLFDERISNLAG